MTQDARSEQRKATTAATSSGSPKRPSGAFFAWVAIASSGVPAARAATCSARPPSPFQSGVPVGPARPR